MAAPARLLVPSGYASGANVSASSTWNGATISSLGLIEGTYQYTWAGDSLTIIIPGPSGCLSVTNSPQSYTGSPIAATVTCSSGGSASNILYNGSSSVPSAAGTYAITANCTAGSNLLAVIGGSAGNLVISPATPAPPPQHIPTLSEWAQIMMILMMASAAGWQTRRVIRRR